MGGEAPTSRRRKRKALQQPLPPRAQSQARNQKLSAQISMGPNDWDEWLEFVVEPVGKGGQLLQRESPGRYNVVLYVGSSVPEPRMQEALLQPRPCPLRISGVVKLLGGHPRDGDVPPEFSLISDANVSWTALRSSWNGGTLILRSQAQD
jgi:hypothetical protein